MFSSTTFLDKNILVTGSNGSLGRVFCRSLAQHGANLILLDHPDSDFSSTHDLLSDLDSVDFYSIKADLLDEQSRQSAINHIQDRFTSLHCVVNNAAFVASSSDSGWSVSFENQSLSSWRNALEINLTAPFHLSQGLLSLLLKSDDPSIINISSIYGSLGPDWSLYRSTAMANPAGYSVSKGGLVQLTRWLATTLAPHVRVNSISPGGIFRGQPEQFVDKYVDKCPLGRMAKETDVVGALLFLASDLSSYITGENLFVDGGWSKW